MPMLEPSEMAPASSEDWREYWEQDDFWSDSEIWKINAELFFRRSLSMIQPKPDDKVLNIGCGPGYLERLLAPQVHSICAVDTSHRFVDLCRKNCTGYSNIQVRGLESEYTAVELLGRYSLYLCISVVQYYRVKEELKELILSAKRSALPGARMLIADLPLQRQGMGIVWDLLCSLFQSFKEGYAKIFFVTVTRFFLNDGGFRKFSRRVKTLFFTYEELEDLIHELDLKAKIITKGLSIYANRPSLWIEF